MFAMVLGTGFYLLLVLPYAPVPALLAWFCPGFALEVVAILYLFLLHRYMGPPGRQTKVFNAIIFAMVLVLGTSNYFMLGYASQSVPTQMILVILIIGTVSGAAFTLSANRYTFLLSSIPYSVPTVVFLAGAAEQTYWLLAGIVVVFDGILIWLSNREYRMAHNLILARFDLQGQKEQLSATLDEVNKLKQQQDGDYFLTALLLQPLGVNRTSGESLRVEFKVRQNKKFTFGKKRAEIGGDICIAHDLTLRDAQYTAFINADAMGKSIQGAGGALVLGAVFQSIIERSRTISAYRSIYPERWLKNTFAELHAVFESFDGTMLSSGFLGLIDHENGMLFFINAEHPKPVLFRAGHATFLPGEAIFYKLGTTGLSGGLHIDTFRLLPGDVLIVGSDGRDDLMVASDAQGARVINEDETLFLRNVQAAGADLAKIVQILDASGQTTDDLSLMRLEYFGPAAARSLPTPHSVDLSALSEAMRNGDTARALSALAALAAQTVTDAATLHRLLKYAVRLKDYGRAAIIAENYALVAPQEIMPLYIASYCQFRLRNFLRAADLGERVRLRAPGFTKNLLNLARIYLHLRNEKRVRELVEAVRRVEPGNPQAARLFAHLGLEP